MEQKSTKTDLSGGDNASTSSKARTSSSRASGASQGNGIKSTNGSKRPSSKKKEDETIITIDLTDPEDLIRKMEMIDFTEEETEELMKQAMEVNKMLKKELQKHEFESLRQSFSRAVTISTATGERTSGLMSLPPVDKDGKTHLASLSFDKKTPASAAGISRSTISGSRKSSAGGSSKKDSAKPKKSAAPKAEWSDRWN